VVNHVIILSRVSIIINHNNSNAKQSPKQSSTIIKQYFHPLQFLGDL